MTRDEERAYAKGVKDTKKAILLWCKDMEKINRSLAKGTGAVGVANALYKAEALQSLASDVKNGFLYRDNDPRSK